MTYGPYSFINFQRNRYFPLIKKIAQKLNLVSIYNFYKYNTLLFHTKQISDEKFIRTLKKSYQSTESFIDGFKKRNRPILQLPINEKEEIFELFGNQFPQYIEAIKNEADEICSHVFEILGSEPVNLNGFIKMNSDNRCYIPWHLDIKSGYQWDSNTYYRNVRNIDINGTDIKVPWELSRCHHLITLGQAYWLTGDEKYTKEFILQVNDWIDNNPLYCGVNWTCTMDVAIRACNWIAGYYLIKDSPKLTDEFLLKVLKSIYLHGKFIMNNLEWSETLTSNHYLSNIIGLIYLGVMFPEFKEAKGWRDFGLKELINEMEKQVYSDGCDFEASTSYHRLVTELFYSAGLLCKINNIELPIEFWNKLEKMFDFILHYTKANNKAPQIGDNDNGRFLIFKKREILDHSYLLTIAAILFENSKYKINKSGFDEEALWLFGSRGYTRYNTLIPLEKQISSKGFYHAGIFIMRNKSNHLIISCGPNGQNGNGGHAHNDKLSFELNIEGKDIIVDPGSYIYTSEPKWRNKFRSTSSHNTVVIDGMEQNRFIGGNLFIMKDDSNAKCLKWENETDFDTFIGEHYGYQRLEFPVIHRREIYLNKREMCCEVMDIFKGKGEHTFEWFFHFVPMEIEQDDSNPLIVRTKCESINIELEPKNPPDGLKCEILEGWISYEYGKKVKAPIVRYQLKSNVDQKDLINKFIIIQV